MHSRQALTTMPRPSAGIYLQYNCWVSCSMTTPPPTNSLWPQGYGFLGLKLLLLPGYLRVPQIPSHLLRNIRRAPRSTIHRPRVRRGWVGWS